MRDFPIGGGCERLKKYQTLVEAPERCCCVCVRRRGPCHRANAAVQGKHKRGAKLLMENSGVARLVDESGKVVQKIVHSRFRAFARLVRLGPRRTRGVQ